MKNTISSILKDIEDNYNVTILYACEAGSRAWGLESDFSDYDVRFLYVHPSSYYLSIDPIGTSHKRDVIDYELSATDKLEISGWELTKALRLFRKSNPSLFEWLHSPIVYDESFPTVQWMKKLIPNVLEQKSCILHYTNMARGNYEKARTVQHPKVKTMINIIRPLLAAKWILNYCDFPPLHLQRLVDHFIPKGELHSNIYKLINQKKYPEGDYPFHNQTILGYASDEIESLKDKALSMNSNQHKVTDKLDHIFRETLKQISKL